MKNRLFVRGILIASMLMLPRVFGIGYESGRMAILAGMVAAVALLGSLRIVSGTALRLIEAGVAFFILSIAWFESFVAWNHSAEIGLYMLFGAAVLVVSQWPAVRAAEEAVR